MFQLTLILYPHHTVVHSELLYTNRSFEICMLVHGNGIPMEIPWQTSHGWYGTEQA